MENEGLQKMSYRQFNEWDKIKGEQATVSIKIVVLNRMGNITVYKQGCVSPLQCYRWFLEQVRLHEISRLPARLCPPRQKRYGPTDRRTDTPSYRVVAHD